MDDAEFRRLIGEAEQSGFSGWDFSYLNGRWQSEDPSWDYMAKVRPLAGQVDALLEMDTGGGERFATLQPFPPQTYALENYPPNVALARERLEPLGVRVLQCESYAKLPFENDSLDLVINRHGEFDAGEIFRILKPGGKFITQQVGGLHYKELNEAIDPAIRYPYWDWNLAAVVQQLADAGFQIVEQAEEFPPTAFYDIGAIAYYLKAIPWQIPGFSIEKYRQQLAQIHRVIQETGSFVTNNHYFIIEAVKPAQAS